MKNDKADRNFPAIRLADGPQADNPAETHKRMLSELAERLDQYNVFAKGQFVMWKPGLKNRKFPDYGELILDCDPTQASALLWASLRCGAAPMVKPLRAHEIDRRSPGRRAMASPSSRSTCVPGRDGVDVTTVLSTADFVVVPAQPTVLDIQGSFATRCTDRRPWDPPERAAQPRAQRHGRARPSLPRQIRGKGPGA